MKKLAVCAVVMMLVNVAMADFVAGRVRPVMRANLTLIDGPAYPQGQTLSLNKMDGFSRPVSFTMVFDTGIRCFRAPCPSRKVVEFRIEKIIPFHGDEIRYEAIEVFKHIPANVRMAPRRLIVTQSSMELVAPGGNGFMRRTMWDVELEQFSNKTQTYSGEAKALYVTM